MTQHAGTSDPQLPAPHAPDTTHGGFLHEALLRRAQGTGQAQSEGQGQGIGQAQGVGHAQGVRLAQGVEHGPTQTGGCSILDPQTIGVGDKRMSRTEANEGGGKKARHGASGLAFL